VRGTILVMCGLCAVLSACALDPARSCSQDTDCDGNGYCDPGTKTCVASLCSCGVGEACVRGACAVAHSDVKLTATPTVNGEVGRTVTLTAQLEPSNSLPHVDPDAVTVHVAAGSTAQDVVLNAVDAGVDGLYAATWQTPPQDGTQYLLTVDAGFPNTASLSVRAHLAGPTLSLRFLNLSVPTGINADPAGADVYPYRRDQRAQVEVAASADVDSGTVQVSLADSNGMMSALPIGPFAPCDAGLCADFTVDLSTPVMNAFRTVFPLVVKASNSLQNSTVLDAGIGVTRWVWQQQFPGEIYASPAIDSAGTVYVGIRQTSTSGGLIAITSNGNAEWLLDGGSVDGSPAVGEWNSGQRVYVAFVQSGGVSLSSILTDGGGLYECPHSSDVATTSISILRTSLGGEDLETATMLSGGGTVTRFLSRFAQAHHNLHTNVRRGLLLGLFVIWKE
jgi:hypothetical protein